MDNNDLARELIKIAGELGDDLAAELQKAISGLKGMSPWDKDEALNKIRAREQMDAQLRNEVTSIRNKEDSRLQLFEYGNYTADINTRDYSSGMVYGQWSSWPWLRYEDGSIRYETDSTPPKSVHERLLSSVRRLRGRIFKKSALDTVWYHGSGLNDLEARGLSFGQGMDGEGIYLTRSLKRATMYASRGAEGIDREPHVYEVKVDIQKVWQDKDQVLMSEYTDEAWAKDLVLDGMNARLYLGAEANNILKRHGFQAILGHSDLVVLDKRCIVSVKKIS